MYTKKDIDKITAMSEVVNCAMILLAQFGKPCPISRDDYALAWRQASGYFNDEHGRHLAWSALSKIGWSFKNV